MTLNRLLRVPPPAPGTTIRWTGLAGSAPALAVAELAAVATGPLLVVATGGREAARLTTELEFYCAPDLPVRLFPGHETLPYDPFSPHPDITSSRLESLSALPGLRRGVVVVALEALLQRLPPRRYVDAHTLLLNRGQRIDMAAFRQRLAEAGYAQVGQVMAHGEFAVRGSVIDLFPMGSEVPLRLDLFDDELDSIKRFEPETQRSDEPQERVRLLPAREFPTTPEAVKAFRQRWRARFEGDPMRSPVYRFVSEGLAPAGIEYWLPLFFEDVATLFDYLPPATTVVDMAGLADAASQQWTDIEERYEQRRHDLERPLLPPAELFMPPAELLERCGRHARALLDASAAPLSASAGAGTGTAAGATLDFASAAPPALRLDPRADDAGAPLRSFLADFKGRVLLTADSAGRREVLLEFLHQHDLHPRPVDGWPEFLASGAQLALTVAPDVGGLLLPATGIALIAEEQLFGERARQERRRRRAERDPAAILQELTDLAPGAPVVHEEHGVGRYRGLRVMDVDGQPGEFLVLEYAGGDKLYVPVHALDRISRYTGAPAESAPLHRLGGEQWARARRRAAERIRDVAAELLDLYARRAARPGFATDIREAEYQAFAAAFPFEETVDQAEAIRQVLDDMRAGKPMDRVVCGDVGFGKTEVALRAAFVAVQAGRQVAVLVPTTLLAQQHAQNFADRFADWPIRVENLSRFRTAAEQKKVVAGLKDGTVDVVIGTQRLLQRDVAFSNLGLIIIDEEHRFGVRDKERLKALRADVDTLMLTATPIPRTLNMALGGLRDLSLITTPPAERVAIETFVCEFSEALLREALLREIRRGGQVYYVHNAIETIDEAAARIARVVPEAVARVGHGQMRERDLEQLMLDFYHRRFNVLVCTTIIESGIDVPTANTILIDRADRFGLAQLHQLRGRVGRSHHRAFAYLMAPPKAALKPDALKRLEALESLEDLGAGFTLATHDLEIRGAGELLGEEQSGQIHEIGFSLYMELLERAVAALRSGREPELERPLHAGPEIDLHVPALLPEDYIGDVHLRLRLYKRIAAAADQERLDDLEAELVDRFGPLPPAAQTLLRVATLKLRAALLGIRRLEVGPTGGLLRFADDHKVDPSRVLRLVQRDPQRYRLDGSHGLRFSVVSEEASVRLRIAQALLTELGATV
jgi:transcription-repair coupling factor (superfamily II helicase)